MPRTKDLTKLQRDLIWKLVLQDDRVKGFDCNKVILDGEFSVKDLNDIIDRMTKKVV